MPTPLASPQKILNVLYLYTVDISTRVVSCLQKVLTFYHVHTLEYVCILSQTRPMRNYASH